MSPIARATRAWKLLTKGPRRAVPGRGRRILALNALPHPDWLDAFPNALTVVTRGGAIWVAGALAAYLCRVPRSGQALAVLVPSVAGTTLAVEYLLKAAIRRPRPVTARVRALLLGQRYRSSFPSTQAASSFASAWVLSTVWPRWAPIFFGLALSVGYNRVYLGAHRATDVAAGALTGVALAELLRRGTSRLFN